MIMQRWTIRGFSREPLIAYRYFYSWGPSAETGDEEVARLMIKTAAMAFQEDKEIIEAQQKVIQANPGKAPMPTVHDRALIRFRRMMNTLMKAQST